MSDFFDRTTSHLVHYAQMAAHNSFARIRPISEEENRSRELSERFLSESAKAQAEAAQMQAQVSSLTSELKGEKERSARTTVALTAERDQVRQELLTDKTRIAEAQGALSEAKDQVGREEERNWELSDRVIAEASKAQALAARVAELETQAQRSHRKPKHEE
jgi:predicted  nucleic acid-binding Zn-ribbon protein